MVTLFAKLEAPALTDVEIEPVAGAEIVPERIPDVYLGEPITVALRAPALPSRVVLRGRLGVEVWERVLTLHPTGEGAGLSSYWASGKIAALLDRRRTGTSEDEIRLSVLELALTYHLVSPYTSLVAVDKTPARSAPAALERRNIPNTMPAGAQWQAAFPKTATPGPLLRWLGALALILAGALVVATHLPRRLS
jgi:Ca-activated chloride channel family protein